MFIAQFKDGSMFKKIVESIKDIVNDVNLETSPNGISLQAMDSSHVALVQLRLERDAFEDDYRSDKSMVLGINMANLAKIMKLAQNDDVIILKTDENSGKLTIILKNTNMGRHATFDLNLFNIDSESLGIPDTEYSAKVRMPSSEFTKMCKDVYLISETLTIEATKEKVIFYVEGDVGKGNIELEHIEKENSVDSTILQVSDPVKLSFALRYINMFNKASTISQCVSFMMSAESPLVVEYSQQGQCSLKFYLAPKISEEPA